jgi:PAS domain S-box-containing protein
MPIPPAIVPDVEGFLRSLLRNVPGAVYRSEVDDEFAMQLMGDEIERITGYPASDFVANARRSFHSVIHPADRQRVHDETRDALEGGVAFALEYRIVTAAGDVRWVLDRGLGAVDALGRECVDGIIFDITARRRAEEARRRSEAEAARVRELEAARARIIAAADDARRRIERDLHDGAQQSLVAVALTLRLAERRLEAAEHDASLVAGARAELEAALAELRELARGIHPAILSDRGLAEALRALAGRAPLPVELECDLDERLDPAVEAALYYCAAEALTNAARHARATQVEIRLAASGATVALEVADDGVGGAAPGSGSGLRGLDDRLSAVGGTLEIESAAGRGTRVRARAPRRPADTADAHPRTRT